MFSEKDAELITQFVQTALGVFFFMSAFSHFGRWFQRNATASYKGLQTESIESMLLIIMFNKYFRQDFNMDQ